MNRLRFSFIFSSLLLLASCAAKKAQMQDHGSSLPSATSAELLSKMTEKEVAVEWLNAKARISFQDASQSRKFTATIRMRKDSIIWMNVKKLSAEFARILIDKDSVYVLDRLNKEYYIKGLEFIEQEFHLPADFDALQTMILGNPFFYRNPTFKVAIQDQQYHLKGEEDGGMYSDYWLNGLSFLLEQMAFLDLRNDRKLVIGYEDYQPLSEGETDFAFLRKFKMNSEKTGEVEVKLQFISVEKDVPKKMPFSISSRYKRVD